MPGTWGQTWERPVSVELIHPDGTDGFQIDAGLRIRGGYSRAAATQARLSSVLRCPSMVLPRSSTRSSTTEGVAEFESVDLRTSQNYSWSYEGGNSNSHDTFVREVFSRDTQRDMGQPYTRSRYYHLYLDGQYWGLYQTQERPEASYAASYFGGDKEDYDVIKSRGPATAATISRPPTARSTPGGCSGRRRDQASTTTTPITVSRA